jgi:hypothetical protein
LKRIHAFGCSLTAQHHWFGLHSQAAHNFHIHKAAKNGIVGFVDEETGEHRDKIKTGREPWHWSDKNLDVSSYAISGGATNMQLVQYGNGVADGSIDKDDIIIWQITNQSRHGIFWDMWLDKETVPDSPVNNVREYGVLQTNHAFVDKLYDGENEFQPMRMNMINRGLGCNPKTPIPEQYEEIVGHSQRNYETIYDQMWSLNGIAKRNPKTLVVYGWYDAFLINDKNYKPKLDAFLLDNEIEFIEEPILEFSNRMGHPLQDSHHPHWHGYKAFTDEVLKIKLQQLGWI